MYPLMLNDKLLQDMDSSGRLFDDAPIDSEYIVGRASSININAYIDTGQPLR